MLRKELRVAAWWLPQSADVKPLGDGEDALV